jgi:hypothetical protein
MEESICGQLQTQRAKDATNFEYQQRIAEVT